MTDRKLALIRTFQSAFLALADFKAKSPAEAEEVADIVAAHLRSAHPMASGASGDPDPIGELRVNLTPDGAHSHMYVTEHLFGICLHDALGDSATVVCEVAAAERWIHASRRVLAAVGRGR